jgi:hypothetical protein
MIKYIQLSKTQVRAGLLSMVECLPCMPEALGSILSTIKNKNNLKHLSNYRTHLKLKVIPLRTQWSNILALSRPCFE